MSFFYVTNAKYSAERYIRLGKPLLAPTHVIDVADIHLFCSSSTDSLNLDTRSEGSKRPGLMGIWGGASYTQALCHWAQRALLSTQPGIAQRAIALFRGRLAFFAARIRERPQRREVSCPVTLPLDALPHNCMRQ